MVAWWPGSYDSKVAMYVCTSMYQCNASIYVNMCEYNYVLIYLHFLYFCVSCACFYILYALNKPLLLVLLLNTRIYVIVYLLILSSLTKFKDYSLVIYNFSASLPNKSFIHSLKCHVNILMVCSLVHDIRVFGLYCDDWN